MRSKCALLAMVAAAGVAVIGGTDTCCPIANVLHATLVPDDDSDIRSTGGGGGGLKVQGGGQLRRRLAQDTRCMQNRTTHFTEFEAHEGFLFWQLQGDSMEETEFSRFIRDMESDERYWQVEGGAVVPNDRKVVAISVNVDANFSADWWFDEPAKIGDVCESDAVWAGVDMTNAIKDRALWVVILATPAVKDSWTAWLKKWQTTFGDSSCGTGCLLGIGDLASGGLQGSKLVSAVHSTIASIPYGSGGANPFKGCTPCLLDPPFSSTEEAAEGGSHDGPTTTPEPSTSAAFRRAVTPFLLFAAVATVLPQLF